MSSNILDPEQSLSQMKDLSKRTNERDEVGREEKKVSTIITNQQNLKYILGSNEIK